MTRRYSSTSNPFSLDYDASHYGGYAPNRTYDRFQGTDSYGDRYGQTYPSNYQPYYTGRNRDGRSGYGSVSGQASFHYRYYENPYAVGSTSNRRRAQDDHLVRSGRASHSAGPSLLHVGTSVRREFASPSSPRTNLHRYNTTSYEPQDRQYRETVQPRSRHTIYTIPRRRRDVVMGWFSRDNDGRNERRHGTDEGEEYRRVRHRERPNEQPRSHGFRRPSWLNRR